MCRVFDMPLPDDFGAIAPWRQSFGLCSFVEFWEIYIYIFFFLIRCSSSNLDVWVECFFSNCDPHKSAKHFWCHGPSFCGTCSMPFSTDGAHGLAPVGCAGKRRAFLLSASHDSHYRVLLADAVLCPFFARVFVQCFWSSWHPSHTGPLSCFLY